jgi:hypothetical protein
LKVLQGQTPDYMIFPNASAFVAEGLVPADVAEALDELYREGKLEREIIPQGEPTDNGETIPGGYRLRSQRRKDATMRHETDEPTTPTPTPTPPDGDDDGDGDETT